MGVSYKGGATYYHSIADNINLVAKTYPYVKGYFGDEGNNKKIRIITSDDPAKTGLDFYSKIAYGGIEEKLPNGKGVKTSLADGTIITFRPTTKSDSNPGIDINITKSTDSGGLKTQKIHFEEEI